MNEGKGRFDFIEFINDNVALMLKSNTIMKTVDGGRTWNTIYVEENGGISRLNFTDEFTGWAVFDTWEDGYGPRSRIIKSTDGGTSWDFKSEGLEFDPEILFVVNDSVVFVMEGENLLKTDDNGQNWYDITPVLIGKSLGSIWFFSPESGIVTCNSGDSTGIIYRTIDGGNTWKKQKVSDFSSLIDLRFINDSTGFFRGNFTVLCKTTDTLNTLTELNQNFDAHSYAILNEDTIFAFSQRNSDSIMISVDAGLTWKAITHPGTDFPASIDISPSHDIYLTSQVAGQRIQFSCLWKSYDLGENWKIQILSYLLTMSGL